MAHITNIAHGCEWLWGFNVRNGRKNHGQPMLLVWMKYDELSGIPVAEFHGLWEI